MIEFTSVSLSPVNDIQEGRSVFELREKVFVVINGTPFCTIPAGFTSDGASIPSWARSKWSSWGKYTNASLLHDYLLLHTNHPKWLVDVLFYIALRESDVSALEAAIFFGAVRLKRSR